MEVIKAMAVQGNPNSVSDAGVGALCARSAVLGAYLNVCINASGSESDENISAILPKQKVWRRKPCWLKWRFCNW